MDLISTIKMLSLPPLHLLLRSLRVQISDMVTCHKILFADKQQAHLQVHGSAPDIAGQDKANPMAMVLSAAMMCRYGLNLPKVNWMALSLC